MFSGLGVGLGRIFPFAIIVDLFFRFRPLSSRVRRACARSKQAGSGARCPEKKVESHGPTSAFVVARWAEPLAPIPQIGRLSAQDCALKTHHRRFPGLFLTSLDRPRPRPSRSTGEDSEDSGGENSEAEAVTRRRRADRVGSCREEKVRRGLRLAASPRPSGRRRRTRHRPRRAFATCCGSQPGTVEPASGRGARAGTVDFGPGSPRRRAPVFPSAPFLRQPLPRSPEPIQRHAPGSPCPRDAD